MGDATVRRCGARSFVGGNSYRQRRPHQCVRCRWPTRVPQYRAPSCRDRPARNPRGDRPRDRPFGRRAHRTHSGSAARRQRAGNCSIPGGCGRHGRRPGGRRRRNHHGRGRSGAALDAVLFPGPGVGSGPGRARFSPEGGILAARPRRFHGVPRSAGGPAAIKTRSVFALASAVPRAHRRCALVGRRIALRRRQGAAGL